MKRVLIAENHPLMRDAVKSLLNDREGFEIIGEVGDAQACLVQLEQSVPDILILDLNMPGKGGFHVLREIQSRKLDVHVFIFSMYSGREFVERARSLGARGFVAKEDIGAEVVSLLEAETLNFLMSSSAGKTSPEQAPFIATDVDPASDLTELLTHSEMKVMKLLAEGKSSTEASATLGVSTRTIHTHRQNIREKLGLKGPNALIVYAMQNRVKLLG